MEVIALCDMESPTQYVDVVIPTSTYILHRLESSLLISRSTLVDNKGRHAIGLVWWLLAREVLRLRGTLATRETEWDMMVDLYFYRDPEAEENKEALEEAKVPGADEVGPAAIDQGFGGNAEWEVQGGTTVGAFSAASNTAAAAATTSWEGDGQDWATTAPGTGTGTEGANADVQW